MDPNKTKAAYKAWLREMDTFRGIVGFSAACDYDPQKTLSECREYDLICVAKELGLIRDCVQHAIDAAKVVAHLNDEPEVQAAIDAAEKYLNDPTGESCFALKTAMYYLAVMVKKLSGEPYVAARAADAAWSAALAAEAAEESVSGVTQMDKWDKGVRIMNMGVALVSVEKAAAEAVAAAKGNPELLHKLKELMQSFRNNVYNALMVELENS